MTSFHQEIQWYHQKVYKTHVNVQKSHSSLQFNLKKNTLRNVKSISHCNDESVEPASSTEAIFDITGNFGTVQSWSKPIFPFQYMSSIAHPIALLMGEVKICATVFFVGNLILNNFWSKHFSILLVLLAAFGPKRTYFLFSAYYFKNDKSLVPPSSRHAPSKFFVGNLILYNFCLKQFSIRSIILEAFSPKKNLLLNSSTRQMFGAS